MSSKVDARGRSCPQPAILARKAIRTGEIPIEGLVETVTLCENVRRAAEKFSCTVQVEELEDEFTLTLAK